MVMLAIFAQVWVVSAQEQTGVEKGLVGSWDLEVTLRDCDTGTAFASFTAINTYNQGGTMHQAAILPNPGVVPSGGHGVWSHLTGRHYSAAFRFFSFNLAGVFTDKVTVRSIISLEQSGDSYTSTDTAEILLANGVLINACSTTTATRFR